MPFFPTKFRKLVEHTLFKTIYWLVIYFTLSLFPGKNSEHFSLLFLAGIFACCSIPCERIFVKYWNVYYSAILKSLHVGNVKVIYETFIGAFQDAFP